MVDYAHNQNFVSFCCLLCMTVFDVCCTNKIKNKVYTYKSRPAANIIHGHALCSSCDLDLDLDLDPITLIYDLDLDM